jgi:RimJ/RimL family protein N-acetyltransferase
MFNLVFESNVASIKLWRRLGFKEIGRIPKAGRLRGQGATPDTEGYVDAIQFYWDFETMVVPAEY